MKGRNRIHSTGLSEHGKRANQILRKGGQVVNSHIALIFLQKIKKKNPSSEVYDKSFVYYHNQPPTPSVSNAFWQNNKKHQSVTSTEVHVNLHPMDTSSRIRLSFYRHRYFLMLLYSDQGDVCFCGQPWTFICIAGCVKKMRAKMVPA